MSDRPPNYGRQAKVDKKSMDTSQASVMAMIANLQEQEGPKGVVKDSDGKISPQLAPSEVTRYTTIFKLAKSVLNPGPEAGKVESTRSKAMDNAPNTPMMSSIGKASKEGKSPFSSLLSMGMLALVPLVMGVAKVVSDVVDSFGEVASDVKDTIGDVVKYLKAFNAMESIGKILKPLKFMFLGLKMGLDKISKGALKLIKVVGGKPLQGVIKGFEKMVDIGKSIGKFFGGPMGKIGKVGSAIGKVVKGGGGLIKMFAKVSSKLGKTLKFLPFVGSIFSFMASYKAFKDGKWGRGILELLSGILNLVPGLGTIASGLLDGGMLLYDLLGGGEEGEGEGGGAMAKMGDLASKGGAFFKDLGVKILDSLKNIFGGLGEWISDMAMGMINKAKEFLGLGESEEDKALKKAQEEVYKVGIKDEKGKAKDASIKAIKDYNPQAFRDAQMKGNEYFGSYLEDTKVKMTSEAKGAISTPQVSMVGSNGESIRALDEIRTIEREALQQRATMIGLLTKIASNTNQGGIDFSNDSLTKEFYAY